MHVTGKALVLLPSLLLLGSARLAAQGDGGNRISVENIRLNRTGHILADVVLKEGRMPPRGMVDVEFEWGGSRERVRATGVTLPNRPRTVSTRQPFPCDATQKVKAIARPALSGHQPSLRSGDSEGTDPAKPFEAELSRKCTRTQGTPNLVVASLQRVPGRNPGPAGLKSPNHTPVTVRVTVRNSSTYDMPWNETGGTPWGVQVIGYARNPYMVRRPIKAGESYSFNVDVAVPCGRITQVEAWADARGNIVESDENDNRARFPVEGNACQDAG